MFNLGHTIKMEHATVTDGCTEGFYDAENLHGYTSGFCGRVRNAQSVNHPSVLSSVVHELKQAGPQKSGILLLFLVHQKCVLFQKLVLWVFIAMY